MSQNNKKAVLTSLYIMFQAEYCNTTPAKEVTMNSSAVLQNSFSPNVLNTSAWWEAWLTRRVCCSSSYSISWSSVRSHLLGNQATSKWVSQHRPNKWVQILTITLRAVQTLILVYTWYLKSREDNYSKSIEIQVHTWPLKRLIAKSIAGVLLDTSSLHIVFHTHDLTWT